MNINYKFKWKYNPNSIRLENWNYGWNGYYYVTICTKNRENYFWKILENKVLLNDIWKIVKKFWLEIPNHFDNVKLDEFIIMPNHIHWIIIIDNSLKNRKNIVDENNIVDNNIVETRQCLVSTGNTENTKYTESQKRFQNQWKKTLSSIIGSFKSVCTKTINKKQNKIFFAWQPRFYEHIIRNEKSLNKIREYIINNPLNWENDDNFKK